MEIDDPTAYTTDRFDVLGQVERALALFEGEDKAPFVFGDGPQAEAWLIHGPFFDELSRALAWARADRALSAAPDDADARAAYDEAAAVALDLDRPVPGGSRVVAPEEFLAAVPALTERIRAGELEPVAVGRDGVPEAVLISHELYRELLKAQLAWRQSPPFLATLDPAVHKPMAKSQRFDIKEFMSKDPVSREIWERIQAEKRTRAEDG